MRKAATQGAGVHERWMRECLRLALHGAGHVSPNPLVGAVLVRGGQVLARGWHRRFGGPHAEIECLKRSGKRGLGRATLYVNLEPCAHYGKTPPCTDAIIASGVGSVVFAMRDPNPLVGGRGMRALRAAGIRVTCGVLEADARHMNRAFIKHITRRVPYVHMKVAQSIDGYIGGRRAPRYLTSVPSLRMVHRWRAAHDAVLVGAGTVRSDNPHLTVRHLPGRDPHVVILDGSLSVREGANALKHEHGRGVFVCTSSGAATRLPGKVRRLESRGIVVLRFPARRGVIALRPVLAALYRFSIGSILVEGGRSVFTQFLRQGLADELSFFVAPLVLGGGVTAFAGRPPLPKDAAFSSRPVGNDVLFSSLLISRRWKKCSQGS